MVWLSTIEQGLIFSVACIGVYITYKILDFPDLSVDGTFPLGASVAAICLHKGVSPYVACMLALLFGGLGGLTTGLIHVKLKITNLLSGILVMIGLYSVNLRIMGKANLPLFNTKSLFTVRVPAVIIIFLFAIGTKIFLDLLLKTKLGFLIKAVGDNEQIVTSLGVNKGVIKILGLMISNALVALAGAIMAQYQGYSDVGMGTGVIVMGLAAVIIGDSFFGKFSFVKGTTTAIFGAIVYKAMIALALKLGLSPVDLKLVTSIIVIIALSLNNIKPKNIFRRNLVSRRDSFVNRRESVESI